LHKKTEGKKRPLGRPKCRWEYNIKMGFKVIGYYGME
jgi:hypothetical protein